jgi:hypothetical protein
VFTGFEVLFFDALAIGVDGRLTGEEALQIFC